MAAWQSTDAMDPVYCINLVSSAARRRRMERRFAWHGLTDHVTFVEAAGTDDADVSRIVAGVDRPDRAVVGCLRSHLAALRRFLDETGPDVAGAIVMEDDVVLHDSFADRFAETMANVPTGTPLVALGYLVSHWEGITWSGRDPQRHDLATLHPSHVWGTQAYWISRSEAARALERLDRPLRDLPDGVTAESITRWSGGLVAYPPLVLEEAFDTTIGGGGRLEWHRQAQRGFDVSQYSGAERLARDSTIGLCMIVRDEAAIVGRCLASVRGLIDTWVICDTGSTDATPEVIRAELEGIPGTLHHRPWQDFGHNRSELMSLARGSADWLLLLDADQEVRQVEFLPPLDSGAVDAYRLRHAGGIEYDISRLVRGDLPWRFEGRTHEYLTCDDRATTSVLLPAWEIVHHGDGSSRSRKFERDRELLAATLEERPDDARTIFYMAQTLESLGEPEAARDHYRRRAGLGGFEEEAWYAQWRAAALLRASDPTTTLGELLAAWSRRPARLEPVHDAIELCLEHGWLSVAHALSSAGVEVERPDDMLFVHRWLYDGGLRADHQRVCAALGIHEVVDTHPSTDAPLLEELVSEVRFALVEVDAVPWSTFNPSIAADGDNLAMIVRSANYRIDADGRYVAVDDERASGGASLDVVRTENYFVRLTEDLSVVDVRPIADRSGRPTHATRIRGLEDCRLFRWDGGWWALATSRDSTADTRATVVLLRLDDTDADEVVIDWAHVLPGPRSDLNEKNWVPWTVGDELHIVYGWLPRRVFRWNPATSSLDSIVERTDAPDRVRWRGSSQGVPMDGGTVFVIHEVTHGPAGRRYLHRFVRVDADGSTHASEAFTFTGTPIEFAAGLARRGDDLVVSFGIEDRLAALAVVSVAEVCQLLKASC